MPPFGDAGELMDLFLCFVGFILVVRRVPNLELDRRTLDILCGGCGGFSVTGEMGSKDLWTKAEPMSSSSELRTPMLIPGAMAGRWASRETVAPVPESRGASVERRTTSSSRRAVTMSCSSRTSSSTSDLPRGEAAKIFLLLPLDWLPRRPPESARLCDGRDMAGAGPVNVT